MHRTKQDEALLIFHLEENEKFVFLNSKQRNTKLSLESLAICEQICNDEIAWENCHLHHSIVTCDDFKMLEKLCEL